MKKLPVRIKITLWFSAVLIVVVALTVALVMSVSNSVMIKGLKDNLVDTVANNFDEVEYYLTVGDVEQDVDRDYYIEYNGGYIEIDDDFLDSVNGVFTSLYKSDGTLIYGENLISKESDNVLFSDSKVQRVESDKNIYYIYDRHLSSNGLDDLWLRGVVAEKQGTAQISDITKWTLIILPLVVVIAIIGGYIIARKSLEPIKHINDVAVEIGESHDLKKRIALGVGNDELHRLANTFDDMFDNLEKSFDAERQFASDASHELRTPMAVIMAQCDYILDSDKETEEYIDGFKTVERQGKKMTKIINDLLDFTRLERRTDAYKKEKFDLSEALTLLCEDMRLIKEKNITLTYDIQPLIEIYGNRQLISRMVTNLISNAYRYGRPNGKTKVSMCSDNCQVTISVSDDGIGIPSEDIDKIFNRFFQGNGSHSGEGTGLGLAMVSEIAKFHDGKVSVESTVNSGSTFTIILSLK